MNKPPNHRLITITVIVLGIILTSVAFWSRLSFTASIQEDTSPLEELTILLPIEEVSRLPGFLTTPMILQRAPVPLNHISSQNTDAIIISIETLNNAKTQETLRSTLITLMKQGVIVVVYHASPAQMIEALDIVVPSATTISDTQYVASSLVYTQEIPVLGSVVIATDNPNADDTITHDIMDHIQRIHTIVNSTE